jgi:tetratricopeptide (TPR) repeat protein
VAVREKLVAGSPRPPGHRVDLLASCLTLADLLSSLQENREQAELLERALALADQLAVEFPDRSALDLSSLGLRGSDLSFALSFRGRIDLGTRLGNVSATVAEELRHVGSRREAEAAFRRAEAAYRRTADLVRRNAKIADDWDLVKCYAGLGALYEEAGRVGEAEQANRQQLVALEKPAAKGPTPALPDAESYVCLRRGLCHYALAHCLSSTDRDRAAADEYRKAAEQLRRGISLTPRPDALRLNVLAWLLATCPDPEVRDPGQAVELATKAVAAISKERSYWGTLGAAHYRAGHWSDAVAALERAVQLGNGGDAYDEFFLAMSHWQLGDKEQARDCYDKAVAWMENNKRSIERNIGRKDELKRFRAEAAALLKVEDQQKQKPD